MSAPWEKYQTPETVSQGGPWSKYGQMTPRQAVDALPEFLTRTADEKQADQSRVDAELKDYQARQAKIPTGVYGPAWKDRAKSRDLYLERIGKSLTAPEAAMVRFGNSAALTLPQHFSKDVNKAVGDAGTEYPGIAVGADVAGFLGPGGLAFKGMEKTARGAGRLLNPAGRVATGSGAASRLSRYAPVVASGAAASVGDYALYEGTVGAGTRAAQEGRLPLLDERLDAAKAAPTDPLAYVGGAVSPLYRAGRGIVTAGKNTVDATKQAGKLKLRSGSFTPTPRAEWAASVMQPKTPQSEAYRMIAKRLAEDDITPEQLHKAIDHYHYAGYSSVDEMLFELAEAASGGKGGGQLKQLAVALGSVGGDAQTTARDAFKDRRLNSLTRLRDDLRSAAGLEGSDFYQYGDELKAAERTLPDYGPAYNQSISDEAWSQTLWPQIETSPSARESLDRAWQYASDRGDLAVAREIDTLIQGLGSNPARSGLPQRTGGNVPQKPSTQALDYIDRSLGGRAQSLRARGDGDIASGAQDAQASLRSVVDPETGLDQPRRVVHELKTAQRALDFGRKAAANGTDLETIQREFAREMKKFADDGVEVLGEETATINSSLMMGWLRGAEDMISKASSPATAIRQLYGTPRQREKMVAMLRGLDESELNMTSGKQADATKRLRQVTGDKYGAGDTPQGRGRFDRERVMLDSENQIVGNSQTGQRNEAVAAQGGLEQKINMALDAIDAPRQMAKKALRHGVNRMVRPGIYKPEINRELGDIMFKGGRKNLQEIVSELERFQKKPKTPQSPPGGTPGTGAAAANLPQKKVAQAGIPGAAAEMTTGAIVGGNIPIDYDRDGEVTMKDRMIGATVGATGARVGRKVVQRATKTRPAGMLEYEQARLRVLNTQPGLQPGTPNYQSAVLEEMQKAGYGGQQSRALRAELAPKVNTDDVPAWKLKGVKPEDTRNVTISHYLDSDGDHAQGAQPSGSSMTKSTPAEERHWAVLKGIATLKNKMGMTNEEALAAIRQVKGINTSKSDLAQSLLKMEPVEDVYRNDMWLFKGRAPATLTPQQLKRAVDDLPASMRQAHDAPDEVVSNGIGVSKEVMRKLAKSNFPAVKSDKMPPGGLPQKPSAPVENPYGLEDVPAWKQDLITASVVGTPIGGAAGLLAYNAYAVEQYNKNKPAMSLQEFLQALDAEQRRRNGQPTAPGLKPGNLPQRAPSQ